MDVGTDASDPRRPMEGADATRRVISYEEQQRAVRSITAAVYRLVPDLEAVD